MYLPKAPAQDQNEARRSGFDLEEEEGDRGRELSRTAEAECICQRLPHKTKAKPSEAGSIWKRKKEAEEGSFREQRKRNVSASF